MDDSYFIISQPSSIEIKVKGSRFIGEATIAETAESATAQLAAIQKRTYDATHNCYAYRFGVPVPATFKYSDDGEPSGTAGKPIYDCIVGRELTNVLVVVTRYFGGTKLGTGGLVRAYSDAAIAALDTAGKTERFVTEPLTFELPFTLYDSFLRLLHQFGITQPNSEFTDKVTVGINIRTSHKAKLLAEFVELTSGQGKVREGN